ncbi:MAG: zinc metallopeptidase [Flavobacteriales bacterium]|nr:zinc metallopeptidase [Flavobacteriales bacterium]MDG1781291.1 zinc metallopeptidase [Flavobacteriales bacterium]
MIIYIIAGAIALIGMFVSRRLKSKFDEYSKLSLQSGLSGKEIAERMLQDEGINDVKVVSTPGKLTDHYNPSTKTVNLSSVVFNERNAAAAAVAAHEVGHAVQHARGYTWLQMRSKLVPIVSLSSRIVQFVIIGGILLINVFPGLLLGGIILFSLTTLFAFITLPVEYDASNRALAWIKENQIVTSTEYDASKDALRWAARTYVVSAIGSLATLLYYLSIYMRRR